MTLVNIPNIGVVNFPDSMSDDDIGKAIRESIIPDYRRQQAAARPPGSGSSVLRGVDVAQGNLYGFGEALGRATGIGALERFGREGRERNVLEAEESLPSSQQMSFERASGVRENVRAAGQALGGSLPSSALPLGGALAGAALGSVVPIIGTGLGAVVGGALGAYPGLVGSNIARQVETSGGIQSEGSAFAAAVPQALAEGVVDRVTLGLGRILGVGGDVVGRELLPRIARGVGVGAVAEVPAEVFQQALERAQAGLDVLGPEAMAEYREAATAAAVVGGTMGGTFAGVLGPRPQPTQEDLQREELRGAIEDVVGARESIPEEVVAGAPVQEQEITPERISQVIERAEQRLASLAVASNNAELRLAEATIADNVDPAEVNAIRREARDINAQASQQRKSINKLKGILSRINTTAAASPPAAAAPATPPVEPVAPPVVPVEPVAVAPIEPAAAAPVPPAVEPAPEAQPEVTPAPAPPVTAEATPPAPAGPRVTGFTTAQGSTYQINDQGQTIRTKRSPGRGQGTTYEPFNALYVDQAEATNILEELRDGGNYRFVVEDGDRPRVIDADESLSGKRAALALFSRTGEFVRYVPAQGQPAVGLSPVEHLYSSDPDGNRISKKHIGNPIVSLETAAPAAEQGQGGELSARRMGGEPQAETEVAAEQAGAGQDKSLALIQKFLADLRTKGPQGQSLADALENALADRRFNANQIYSAFMINNTLLKTMPKGANYKLQFLDELVVTQEDIDAAEASGAKVGDKVQAKVAHPKDAGPGLIKISLADEMLPILNETVAHEAFHVLQNYFRAYDKGFDALLKKSFKKDMTIDELEPSIKRRLQGLKAPGLDQSYFDVLKEGIGDNPLSVREAQAYAFGALTDAAMRGQKVTGLTAPFQRFVNFLRDTFSRLRSGLNGDGYYTAADLLAGASDRAETLTQAAPTSEDQIEFSARATNLSAPEFENWWNGGWNPNAERKQSVARNRDGSPKVFYHGTQKGFKSFGKARSGSLGQEGPFYFSPETDFANDYALNALYAGAKGKKVSGGQRMLPVYLSIQNPFDSTNDFRQYELLDYIDKGLNDGTFEWRDIVTKSDLEYYASNIMSGRLSETQATQSAYRTLRSLITDDYSNWPGIETPAAQNYIRESGFDSFYINEDGVKNTAVYNPRQIKSIFNKFEEGAARKVEFSARRAPGSAARANGNVAGLPRFGQRVTPATASGIDLQVQYDILPRYVASKLGRVVDKPKVERFFAVMQDKMLPAGRMIDEIKKAGGSVPVAMDTYLKEDLLQGKVADMLKKRNKNLYGALTEALSKSGISLQDFENYLYARHAPERNDYIAKINPKLPDGGSGLTNAQAAQFMKEFQQQGKLTKMQGLARMFDKIIADTNKLRVDSGLTPDFRTVARTSDGKPLPNYQSYAPLRGFADESVDADEQIQEFRPKTGKALGARGREDARMLGRQRLAGDIIAHAIMQNTQAVIRSETNKVGQSFLDMVRANPAQTRGVAEVIQTAPLKRTIVNGVVKLIPDISYKNAPDILVVKENGKEVAIRIYDENIAKAMTGASSLSPTSKNLIVQGMANLNRFLAKINTAYNPEFMITNFVRDLQTFGVNVQQYDIDGIAKDSIRDVKSALSGVHDSVRGSNNNPEMKRAFERFQELGGTTDMYGFGDLESRIDEINKVMASVGTQAKSWKDMSKAVTPVIKFIEDYNTIIENGIRTSLFKNLVDRGINEERAAQLAKNVTVNFSKGGEQRVFMNALYLFYNASLQGTMAMMNAIGRSPRVRKIVAGIVVAGVLQDAINSMISEVDDDEKKRYDKIPDHILKNRFVLMDPFNLTERGYFSFPMPYGFNAFYNMGREVSKAGRGEAAPMKAAANILGTFVDSFNPIGGSENWFNFAAPTIIDPVVDVIRNRDFSGRPIVPERGSAGIQLPESQKYWNNTWAPYVGVANFVNSLTGGTPIIPGAVDISPNMLQYAVNFVTGGVGKFVERSFNTVTSTIPGLLRGDLEELDVKGIPFLRSLYGSVTTRENMEVYMNRMEEVLRIRKEISDASQSGQPERVAAAMESYPGQVQIMEVFNRLSRDRSQINQRINEINRNANIPEEIKKDIIKSLRDQQNNLVSMANRLYTQNVERR